MVDVELEKAVTDYTQYRAGFPAELFDRLSTFGIGQRGQTVLDIGVDTGSMARGFARQGCEVVGLDPSEEYLEEAKRIDREIGLRIEYVVGTAERTELEADSFDVVSAGQCWHWCDRPKAINEIKRVLRPRGSLVLAHFDWIPFPGNAVEATEKLIEQYNPEWKLGGGSGLHPEWLADVRSNGFTAIETFSFDVLVSYSHKAWRGRVRTSAGVRAVLKPGMLERFDENLRRILAEGFADEHIRMPHCCWAIVCRAPE